MTRKLEAATVTRRSVLWLGTGLGAGALVGCSSSSTATPAASASGSASASTSAAAAGNTKLSAGTYSATFTSSQSGPGGGGGTQKLSGAYLVDGIAATIDGGTWASTTADQNVFLVVNGGSLTLKNATITKPGDSTNEGACNFYGLNSAILVVGDKSSATVTKCTVTTGSEGSNALFAAGSGSLTANTVTIATTKNSSRGLDATYAGGITAQNMTIDTKGAHCACVATDRGNGTIKATGTNKLTAAGDGSPCIYSTGDISVSGATGSAATSQTMVIEGQNSITLTDSTLTSTGTARMMIYQSFSGDAANPDATSSKATMTIANSTITTSGSVPMIYVTNTTCDVKVTGATLTHPASTPLLSLAEDKWGTSGSNGGHATVTFSGCTLSGALTAGSSSSATLALTNDTKLTGTTSGSVTVTKDGTSSMGA